MDFDDRPGWDEATLRADIRLGIPGVPCEACSTGMLRLAGSKLASKAIYHPANRPCTNKPLPPVQEISDQA
jgi:hypothetical protein